MSLLSWSNNASQSVSLVMHKGRLKYLDSENIFATAPRSTLNAYADGKWHFVVVTHNSYNQAVKVYVDPFSPQPSSTVANQTVVFSCYCCAGGNCSSCWGRVNTTASNSPLNWYEFKALGQPVYSAAATPGDGDRYYRSEQDCQRGVVADAVSAAFLPALSLQLMSPKRRDTDFRLGGQKNMVTGAEAQLFSGELDDTRLYSKVLTAQEAKQVYTQKDEWCYSSARLLSNFTNHTAAAASVATRVPSAVTFHLPSEQLDPLFHQPGCPNINSSDCSANRLAVSIDVCYGSVEAISFSSQDQSRSVFMSSDPAFAGANKQALCVGAYSYPLYVQALVQAKMCAPVSLPVSAAAKYPPPPGRTPLFILTNTTSSISTNGTNSTNTSSTSTTNIRIKANSAAAYRFWQITVATGNTPTLLQATATAGSKQTSQPATNKPSINAFPDGDLKFSCKNWTLGAMSWTIPTLSTGAMCTACQYQLWYVPADHSRRAFQQANLQAVCGLKAVGTLLTNLLSTRQLDQVQLPKTVADGRYIFVLLAVDTSNALERVMAVFDTCPHAHNVLPPTTAPTFVPTRSPTALSNTNPPVFISVRLTTLYEEAPPGSSQLTVLQQQLLSRLLTASAVEVGRFTLIDQGLGTSGKIIVNIRINPFSTTATNTSSPTPAPTALTTTNNSNANTSNSPTPIKSTNSTNSTNSPTFNQTSNNTASPTAAANPTPSPPDVTTKEILARIFAKIYANVSADISPVDRGFFRNSIGMSIYELSPTPPPTPAKETPQGLKIAAIVLGCICGVFLIGILEHWLCDMHKHKHRHDSVSD
eukprot:CAMPEP_0175131362 /NCGR_PEP_ID=MMETSP0087-20121206/6500_1 /TAXON_ID=136419 /ORGANISM="Unknown Unknown, Strain D1" /LENGTH=813 /DNA_ID=CAMNT_0016413643 /DNA_START=573 /DNA_END=3014 /DNA_ORIENTATION=-